MEHTKEVTPQPDVTIDDERTVYIFALHKEKARQWVVEHVVSVRPHTPATR